MGKDSDIYVKQLAGIYVLQSWVKTVIFM